MGQENKKEEPTPKKGWLSKLGNAIFEDESSEKNTETSSTPASENTGAPSKFAYSDVTQNTPANLNIPNSGGVFDEKFYNHFLKVIETNNIEGLDYFEFSRAKKANDSIAGVTEPQKYQMAFNTLKTMPSIPEISKQRLLETADFYVEKLNQEEIEFNEEMKREIEAQVTARLNKAKNKQDEIAKKQQQIIELQNEMSALQAEIGGLNMEAQQAQGNIDSTAKNFKVSLEVVKGQINLDKQNINTYIQ
jgi:hypothetical protein